MLLTKFHLFLCKPPNENEMIIIPRMPWILPIRRTPPRGLPDMAVRSLLASIPDSFHGKTLLYLVSYYHIEKNTSYRDIYTIPVEGGTAVNITNSAVKEFNAAPTAVLEILASFAIFSINSAFVIFPILLHW